MCVLQAGQIVEVAALDTCCFRLHFETLDNRTALSLPKIPNLPRKEGLSGAGASSFVRSFRPGFGANGENEAAALATDRAFCGRIFHLLEAALRAFRTDFYKRRIGHWTLSQGPSLYARSKGWP